MGAATRLYEEAVVKLNAERARADRLAAALLDLCEYCKAFGDEPAEESQKAHAALVEHAQARRGE